MEAGEPLVSKGFLGRCGESSSTRGREKAESPFAKENGPAGTPEEKTQAEGDRDHPS